MKNMVPGILENSQKLLGGLLWWYPEYILAIAYYDTPTSKIFIHSTMKKT